MSSRTLLAPLLVCSLLTLAGCTSSAVPWTLVWSPSQRSLSSNQAQAAYQASAFAQRPDGVLRPPALSHWLATGSRPALGLALAQLDTAGQFFSLSVITIDPGSLWWTLTDQLAVSRPAPGRGIPAAQAAGRAWTLPPGTYNSASLDVPDTPPGGSLQIWLSDRGLELVLARLYDVLPPPTGSTAVTLAAQPGWLVSLGDLTVIALQMESGAYQGLGTLLFASNAGLQQSQHLVAQAAFDLNDVLPA